MVKILALFAVFWGVASVTWGEAFPPRYVGADLSWVENDEGWGVQHWDQGESRDVLDIFLDHGFNLIRLRLFVDPSSPAEGDLPSGYSYQKEVPPHLVGPANGLERTLAYAQKVKSRGLGFLLDFHYSDTWADPGAQHKPYAWRSLDFSSLVQRVYDYTRETLETFIAAGARPDMVQIGNEITYGFLWDPDPSKSGHISQAAQFHALLRAGIQAVRDTDPSILIALHTTEDKAAEWFQKLVESKIDFDIAGISWYPYWHGGPEALRARLHAMSMVLSHPIMVLEYHKNKREVFDSLAVLPQGRGWGALIWEPINWTDKNNAENLMDWRESPQKGFHSNPLLELYPGFRRK